MDADKATGKEIMSYTPDEIRKAAHVHDWVHNILAAEVGLNGLNGQDLRNYAEELERKSQ